MKGKDAMVFRTEDGIVVPYRNRQDVTFFVEAAKESGGPVLEIGCGTGRVLIPTARAGIQVVGLDQSQHMLRVCRERLLREPQDVQCRVQLVRADMRDFELFKRRWQASTEKAREAYGEGDKGRSISLWRELFGDAFPKLTAEEAKRMEAIARGGTGYATSKGRVASEKPGEVHVRVPPHRYYGDSGR